MLEAILIPTLCVTGIGLVCAAVLVIAARFMSVKENELEKKLRECLPGANCGACGFSGCDGYAKALAENPDTKTNLCIPGADAVSKEISDILGREFADTVEHVATVRCSGDCRNTDTKLDYHGIDTCQAVKMMYSGDGMCPCGCLGRGDCARVCPEDAICVDRGLAQVDFRKCIGCGLCAAACPQRIISMMPDVKRQVVSCSNTQKGAVARKNCKNACIGCGKCERNCPEGAISVKENLARIDYDKCSGCGKCSQVCPVGCIRTADYSGKHRQKSCENA